ncbi:MAG: 50S ribosomal protein L11 methyltransferase [Ignavibacteria bacterium]|nr:50S ribosomal protein L11 methyltransferase [Ignavibacteria bacterium]
MDKYKKITIKTDNCNIESICNQLYLFGTESILEEKNKLIFYIEENLLHSFKDFASKLKNKFPNIIIKIENFTDTNWDRKWKSTIEPVYIKNKIVIYPSWKKNKIKTKKGFIKIQIDPKMSFGTGHNETTQLVLEMMLEYISPRDNFILDFGTGTGILAIAAAKLGVNEIIAIDNDIEAINNANENIKINRVSSKISLLYGSIESVKYSNFDVIFANITTETIKKYFKHIYTKLKSNGKLILSGILKEEKEDFKSFLLKKGMLVKEMKERSDWVCFYCLKKQYKNVK